MSHKNQSSEFIHGAHGGHGIFFSCLKARNLGGNLCLDVADARNEIPMKYNL